MSVLVLSLDGVSRTADRAEKSRHIEARRAVVDSAWKRPRGGLPVGDDNTSSAASREETMTLALSAIAEHFVDA